MTTTTIVVLGSLNLDIVVEVPLLPGPGETRLGRGHRQECGGKGANQAVAVARAMAGSTSRVAMVGAVGDDEAGRRLLVSLTHDGVDVSSVRLTAQPTGIALIMVDDHGENMIAVSPGANAAVGAAEVAAVGDLLGPGGVLLSQLEVPLDAVSGAAGAARRAGALVVLNPSPAPSAAADLTALVGLLGQVDVLVVNESEAVALTDLAGSADRIDWAVRAAQSLRDLGPAQVVVTLGGNGSVVLTPEGAEHVAAFPVDPVDAVAAGDSYLGALVGELSTGSGLLEAARVGAAAGALAVSRPGAQASIPRRAEIDALLAGQ